MDTPSTLKEPQFIFALILVFAWLFFVALTLSLYYKGGTTLDGISAVERISAVFGTALGFVWGFYFGQKNSQQLIKLLTERVRELESK